MKRVIIAVIFALLHVLLLSITESNVKAEEKVAIGVVEEVILLPWGVKIPARIDTGAATSSIDARELIVQDNIAQFRLPDKYGGLQMRLPVVDWRFVRSAKARELRPVVEIELCLSTKRILARVNLVDRSRVTYPMIIGRNVLRENFVIDCMKSRCAPPLCTEAQKD